jgi:hypothetical protein
MLQHYIQWMYPGSFVAETNSFLVDQRDVLQSEVPRGAVGYRFFSREEVVLDGETLIGKAKNYSGWRYFGVEVPAEEVLALKGDDLRILRENVRCNGWKRLVRLDIGAWRVLDDNDTAGSRP